MSIWHEIEDEEALDISEDGNSLEVLYNTDNSGNWYVDIPIRFIESVLAKKNEKSY